MRVVCFYTKMAPETRESLSKFAPGVKLIETPREDHFRYVTEMEKLWDGSDDLVVIEQDKVLTAETIPSFAKCDRDWCSFNYSVMPIPPVHLHWITNTGLGCTRVSARAQREVPFSEFKNDNDATWYVCPDCGGKSCWRAMDTRMVKALTSHGFHVHDHGPIEHRHDRADLEKKLAEMREYSESLRGTW